MPTITFADVVHQSISFSTEKPGQQIVLKLIDTPWIQRLRDISQTANTRLVYMFSEHSRFGHSLGVAYLADILMEKLAAKHPNEVSQYRIAVSAAALLHDIGHLAPGSHTAYKTWFPDARDQHEEIGVTIIERDPAIRAVLSFFGKEIPDLVIKVLQESSELPPWTWEIISGGGWNVDRGNWCIVDSILAGVSYGKYNIPALTDSMVLTDDGHLALRENRLDAMLHFALSRHAMYRQVYQHRVLLSADTLNSALVLRLRDIFDKKIYADDTMKAVLQAKSPLDLSLDQIFAMRESWFRYHVFQWSQSSDSILSDLSQRILNRRLFKTIRVTDKDKKSEMRSHLEKIIKDEGFDPRYYLHEISTTNTHKGDSKNAMGVVMDDKTILSLQDAEPLFHSLAQETSSTVKEWFVLPHEAKLKFV